MRHALLTVALLLGACVTQQRFACTSSAQCETYETSGVCEPDDVPDLGPFLGPTHTGICSFGDTKCPSGHRYDAFAKDGLAGQCMPCGGSSDYCCSTQPACEGGLTCDGQRCTCLVDLVSTGDFPVTLCALETDGQLWCDGTLTGTDGTSFTSTVSTPLPGLTHVARVVLEVSSGDSCALDSAGETKCWHAGFPLRTTMLPLSRDIEPYDNNYLDPNSTNMSATYCYVTLAGEVGCMETSSTTVPMPKLTGVRQLVTSTNKYACALKDDGTVWCFSGYEGPLLGGGYATANAPIQIAIGPVQALAASATVCALLVDGTVSCWTPVVDDSMTSAMPSPVVGVTGATQIALGDGSSCALVHDGTVVCWSSPSILNGFQSDGATPLTGLPEHIDRLYASTAALCAARGTDVYCAAHGSLLASAIQVITPYTLVCP